MTSETENELLLRVAAGLDSDVSGIDPESEITWTPTFGLTVAEMCTISRVLREAADGGWNFDMEAAPKDGTDIDLFDGIGVVLGAYTWPQSLEDWWETVGEEDEEPDVEAYQEYLEGEMFGWVGCEPLSTDVLYLNPIAWRHRPKPPTLPPPPAAETTKTEEGGK